MSSLRRMMRGFFSIRQHLIMRLELRERLKVEASDRFELLKVNQMADLIDGTYTTKVQKKIIASNPGLVDTFVLKQDSESIGIISVMYKGGNELEYKIRSIDAFIYNVMILPQFRGKGLVGMMISLLSESLDKERINEVYLAVSTDNTSAIRAYKRIGFSIVERKSFIGAMRHNFPYYTL